MKRKFFWLAFSFLLPTFICQATLAALNTTPTVRIESPADGLMVDAGQLIVFKGSAVDLEDGELTDKQLNWTSDLDNYIGKGKSFERELSAGSHIIILTATDSKGAKGRASVFIIVKKPPEPKVIEEIPEPGVRPEPKIKPEQVVKEKVEKWWSELPAIEFTSVPPYGSFENLEGRVAIQRTGKEEIGKGLLTDLGVAVFIRVNGGWWTKPYWDNPIVKIRAASEQSADGRICLGFWTCNITTGGIDEKATEIVAYLIPLNAKMPLLSGHYNLPAELEKTALAKTKANRVLPDKSMILPDKPAVLSTKLAGVCYGPFRDNQNPDMGIFPSFDELKADMALIPEVTEAIRTYGVTNTPSNIPALCEQASLTCYPGAWLGKYKTENEAEIAGIIQIANQNLGCVKALIIGNEVLLREDLSEAELIGYIKEVKAATDLPITTAEIWKLWFKHPQLAAEVDFLTVHIHPYWEGVAIENAAQYVVEAWKKTKTAFPGKRVVIGETGWPSKGKKVNKAIPSPENQARFLCEFANLALKQGVEYFYFELFDESWKDKFEGEVGAHWGIYNSDGSIKDHHSNLVPKDAAKGISRPAGKISAVRVSVPLVVYSDAGDKENSFQPSGWMGDINDIELDKACQINPHSGKTCIQIIYHPAKIFSQGWSGIYWQYPLNNWGEYPGYELTGANRVTFWARGQNGGERAEFKVGGISDRKFPNHDSFGPVSTGVVKLARDWQMYTINLEGKNTSSLIGGFCWVTNRPSNPKGCTIYLDNIQFE